MQILDQMGRTVVLGDVPKRIVSLVPSQSEYLWELGLENELKGITKFCIHPEVMFKTINKVGGTKTPDMEKIRALKPDLIIGNKEENDKESIAQLEREFPVWMSDIVQLSEAIQMMEQVALLTGRTKQSEPILSEVQASLAGSKNLFKKQRVAYFIWNAPLLLAGKGSFINSLLEHCGFENVAGDMERYPEVSVEQLRQLDPKFCLLSSEPFPFKAEHAARLEVEIPGTTAVFVDGEIFSWYGSRLRFLNAYLNQLKANLYA